jgi:hypothetical protein
LFRALLLPGIIREQTSSAAAATAKAARENTKTKLVGENERKDERRRGDSGIREERLEWESGMTEFCSGKKRFGWGKNDRG